MPTSKKPSSKLSIAFALTGSEASVVKVKKGTTLQDFVELKTLEGLDIRVNGVRMTSDYELKANDSVTATPLVKGGC